VSLSGRRLAVQGTGDGIVTTSCEIGLTETLRKQCEL
jgi:hypothetical protein